MTLIREITPKTMKTLNAIGISSLEQISSLSRKQIDRLQQEHVFDQDIRKQDWVGQAARLIKAHA